MSGVISSGSGPLIGPQPATPIGLDRNIAYEYIIPVQGETSLAFTPVPGFSISITGRSLSITYNGIPLAADTAFTIPIRATNGNGFTDFNLSVLVKGAAVIQIDPSFKAAVVNASLDLRYGVATADAAAPLPINGRLVVGTKIKAIALVSGSSVTGINAATLFVVRVDDAIGRFRVSATAGGTPITPDADATYYFEIATAVNGSPNIYVGDSSRFFITQPATLTYSDAVALPSNFVGAKFVKSIVNAFYVTIASTAGGTTLNANADSFAANESVRLVADRTGSRYFPSIVSNGFVNFTEGVAITDYTIAVASLEPADSFGVLGLPAGLSFDGDTTISGTPVGPLPAQIAVTLIVYLTSTGTASYRYLLLTNTTVAAVVIDRDPDLILDIASRRFYAPGGPAGRADRMQHTFGDIGLVVALESLGIDFVGQDTFSVFYGVWKNLSDSVPLAYEAFTLDAAASKIVIPVAFNTADLLAELAGKDFTDVKGVFGWQFPGDTDFSIRTPAFNVRIYAASDVSSITLGPSVLKQSKPFVGLSGGGATKLDGVSTIGLAVDTWRAIVWRTIDGALVEEIYGLIAGTDATTDGIQRPADYNGATNAKIWVRVSGV